MEIIDIENNDCFDLKLGYRIITPADFIISHMMKATIEFVISK